MSEPERSDNSTDYHFIAVFTLAWLALWILGVLAVARWV